MVVRAIGDELELQTFTRVVRGFETAGGIFGGRGRSLQSPLFVEMICRKAKYRRELLRSNTVLEQRTSRLVFRSVAAMQATRLPQ